MKFTAFNLKKEIVEFLNNNNYLEATPVQEVVIPKALRNENIIVQSATGSGKTHSFLVPIMNNLEINNKIQAIIITPTRELARQTYEFALQFKQIYPELKVKIFTSGIDVSRNEKLLNNSCEVIVATPGRLKSLFDNVDVDLSSLKTIILDEADMLMDEGFIEDIEQIIKHSNNPQIGVYSATISQKVEVFLRKFISPDYVLTMSNKEITSNTVKHHFINTKHNDINELILHFINVKNPYLLMIFASSKEKVQDIYNFLSSKKYKCGILSGNLTPRERKSMLKRINNNEFPIIVCSDIASRGLDIIDVSDVLSVDLPNNIEYYYHRAGRTGRNFKDGNSYIFYDSDHIKMCLKLLENGLIADYFKFSKDYNELVSDTPINKRSQRRTKRVNEDLEKEIKKAVFEAKGKKVKPGYKKKVRNAVERVKKRYKREIIKQDIRRQRVERYKNNGK